MDETRYNELSYDDQKVVDFLMLRKAMRSEQLVKLDNYPKSDVMGIDRMNAERAKLVEALHADGNVADHLRREYSTANASHLFDDQHDHIDSLGRA